MNTDVSGRGCVQFVVLFRNVPRGAKKRRENFQTAYTTSTSKYEPRTYRIKSNLNVQLNFKKIILTELERAAEEALASRQVPQMGDGKPR